MQSLSRLLLHIKLLILLLNNLRVCPSWALHIIEYVC